jgi:hypothetical protein
MISRYFVIGLALVAAVIRARAGAWPDAAGLASLSAGLTCLRLADLRDQPRLKQAAWFCFAITLVTMGIVIKRDFLH